jgi:DNA replication protein DnaC
MEAKMCEKCNNRGYLLNDSKEFMGFCDCPLGIKHKKMFWERTLSAAGIFSEYWYKTMKDFYPQSNFPKHMEFVEKTGKVIGNLDKIHNSNFLWIIYGKKGTGKTLAGSLILISAIQKGYAAKYIVWSDLLSKRLDPKENDPNGLESIKNIDFLVVDKINGDVINDSKFPAETLDLILTYRYSNQKPTILILETDLLSAKKRLPILGEFAGDLNVSEVDGLNFRLTTIR